MVCWPAHACVCALGGAAGGAGRPWHHCTTTACQVSDLLLHICTCLYKYSLHVWLTVWRAAWLKPGCPGNRCS